MKKEAEEGFNTLGEMIKRLAELKDKKDAIKAQESEVNSEIDGLEYKVIMLMEESGIDKSSCNRATATLKIEQYPQVEDMEALVAWCHENDRPDMIQKRVSKAAFDDYFKGTFEYPEGIKTYEKKSILFRRR